MSKFRFTTKPEISASWVKRHPSEGAVIVTPTEAEAWREFLGYDSFEWGLPDEKEWECTEIK